MHSRTMVTSTLWECKLQLRMYRLDYFPVIMKQIVIDWLTDWFTPSILQCLKLYHIVISNFYSARTLREEIDFKNREICRQ